MKTIEQILANVSSLSRLSGLSTLDKKSAELKIPNIPHLSKVSSRGIGLPAIVVKTQELNRLQSLFCQCLSAVNRDLVKHCQLACIEEGVQDEVLETAKTGKTGAKQSKFRRKHCNSKDNDSILHVVVDSASWGARLRYVIPDVLKTLQLQPEFKQIGKIKYHIDIDVEAPARKLFKNHLSTTNEQLWQQALSDLKNKTPD